MTPTQRAAIEKAAELFSRQALGISAWGMTEAHEMAEALSAALAEPAVEPVTDEENERFSQCVSNFNGADPEATKYALEAFLRRRAQAHQPAPPADVPMLTDEERETIAREAWLEVVTSPDIEIGRTEKQIIRIARDNVAIQIQKAVRRKAGLV